LQTYAGILEYQAVHGLDGAALRLTPYLERRRELVGAAQQLARGLGSGTAQVWHAAVVLLDRCAAAGYRSRMDALLAAACVALAAEKEGMELPTALLAALLDAEATQREAGAQPLAALDAELQQVTAALQGDTACLSGGCPRHLCTCALRRAAVRFATAACIPCSCVLTVHEPLVSIHLFPCVCAAMHCWKVFADCLGCAVESPQQVCAWLTATVWCGFCHGACQPHAFDPNTHTPCSTHHHPRLQMEALLGDSFSRLHLLVADPAFTSYPPSVLVSAALVCGCQANDSVSGAGWLPTPRQTRTHTLHPVLPLSSLLPAGRSSCVPGPQAAWSVALLAFGAAAVDWLQRILAF
jgi:hypothetical protein